MPKLIKPFGKGKSNFIHPDEARRRLDEIAIPKAPERHDASSKDPEIFIEELPDRYRMNNVEYIGSLWQIDWSKELLDSGHEHAQSEWVLQTTVDYVANNNFYLPTSRQYYLTMKTLCNANNLSPTQLVLRDELLGLLAEDFIRGHMMTATRVIYCPPPEKDRIIHNRYQQGIEELLELTGKSGDVSAPGVYDNALQSLLDSKNKEELVGVAHLTFGKPAFFARMGKKEPFPAEPRVVLMGNAKDGLEIIAKAALNKEAQARGIIATYK